MEHKGVRYELLQTSHPAGWKWVVHISATKTKTGFSHSKQLAKFAAIKAIDNALKETK
jgi:hypothetical protein